MIVGEEIKYFLKRLHSIVICLPTNLTDTNFENKEYLACFPLYIKMIIRKIQLITSWLNHSYCFEHLLLVNTDQMTSTLDFPTILHTLFFRRNSFTEI